MTISEWSKAHGEVVISAKGRGQALIGQLPNGEFYTWLSLDPNTGRRLDDTPDATLPANANIRDVVDWFLDCVARSEEDKAEILSQWEGK
jgi:hypothetical protein